MDLTFDLFTARGPHCSARLFQLLLLERGLVREGLSASQTLSAAVFMGKVSVVESMIAIG